MRKREGLAERRDFLANRGSDGVVTSRAHDPVEPVRDGAHLGFLESTRGECRGSQAKSAGDHRGTWIVGNTVLVDDDPSRFEPLLGIGAGEVFISRPEVDQHEVVVGAAGTEPVAV